MVNTEEMLRGGKRVDENEKDRLEAKERMQKLRGEKTVDENEKDRLEAKDGMRKLRAEQTEHEHVIDDNGTRSTNGEGKSNTKTKTKATDVEEGGKARVVVLGGSEYACFVANAMDSLGADVSLVTTRPTSLKDTPLNPLRDSNGTCTDVL